MDGLLHLFPLQIGRLLESDVDTFRQLLRRRLQDKRGKVRRTSSRLLCMFLHSICRPRRL